MATLLNTASLILATALTAPGAAAETRRIDGLAFDQIVVVGDVDVEVSQSDTPTLYLRGDEEVLDIDPFYLKGERLVLGKSARSRKIRGSSVRYKVELPVLRELEVLGSGAAYVKPFDLTTIDDDDVPTITIDGSGDIKLYGLQGAAVSLRVKGSGDLAAVSVDVEDVEAIVAGSGDLYMKVLQAQDVSIVVTGSGDLGVSQPSYVDHLNLRVVGSGDADLDEVSCRHAEIKVVGSGTALIGEVEEMLSASILGNGDVRYRGKPEVDKSVIGSGEVRGRN